MTIQFEEALKAMKNGKSTRLSQWKEDVYISIQRPEQGDQMTAPYMYVTSKNGKVPWIPTQIEIMSNQWEICKDSKIQKSYINDEVLKLKCVN